MAVKSVLNGTKTDDEILAAFRDCGYVDNRGMSHHNWTKAATSLGLDLEGVRIPRRDGKWQTYDNWFHGEQQRYVRGRYTLREFCDDNPEGVYFLSTRDHALVVVDGFIWDPNCAGSSMTRGVTGAKLVKNSPLRRLKNGKIRWIKTGKVGSRSQYRRMNAQLYINNNTGSVEIEELISKTQYTRADYEFDLKRGNLKYADD